MVKQAIRQEARRAAMEARAGRRGAQVARERRLTRLVAEVLTALGERDALVAEFDHRAGRAVDQMTREGLTLREAASWFGDRVSATEIARLRRSARRTPE